jgi:hypothetical protein
MFLGYFDWLFCWLYTNITRLLGLAILLVVN